VNKPYLPLASGEFTPAAGAGIVAACTAGAFAIGLASGSAPLLWTLAASLVLGVLYSADLPLMRWKRSPLLAAGCILAVRAVFVQVRGCRRRQRSAGQRHKGLEPMLWQGA
jgi:homogentisate phytyltransferase/homogentisate geranylgeranyltransferase